MWSFVRRLTVFGILIAVSGRVSAAPDPNRAEGQAPPKRGPAGARATQTGSFHVEDWASLTERVLPHAPPAPKLDLDVATREDVEEITVYAKRLRRTQQEDPTADTPILLGPASVSGTQVQNGGFSGLTVTAAVPIGGIPGLDAVLNLSGGYDQVSASTTSGSAAATAGLRLRF